MASVKAIRRQLKQRRLSIPANRHRDMSSRLCRHLARSNVFRTAERIAAYLPFGGEPDLLPLLLAARRQGKLVCLPVVEHFPRRLGFRAWHPGQALTRNRYGIPEPPITAECIAPQGLDLILTPLVAFDARGNRIGMGAGFYDRTFSFRKLRSSWQAPRLVGTAWSFQQVPALEAMPWDVALDDTVTELGWIAQE